MKMFARYICIYFLVVNFLFSIVLPSSSSSLSQIESLQIEEIEFEINGNTEVDVQDSLEISKNSLSLSLSLSEDLVGKVACWFTGEITYLDALDSELNVPVNFAYCLKENCQNMIEVYFVKGELGAISNFLTLNEAELALLTTCKDLSNPESPTLTSVLNIGLSVQDDVPFNERSFLDLLWNRGNSIDSNLVSQFIASSKSNTPVKGWVPTFKVDKEVYYQWTPFSELINTYPEVESQTFIPNPFISGFEFNQFEIKINSGVSNIKEPVPYRIKLDSPQLIFSFNPNTSFRSEYKCTIIGNIFYYVANQPNEQMSIKNAWAAFLTCKNNFCSESISSLFTRGTIPDFNDLRQLHSSKANFHVQCKDLSIDNPHPEISIQFSMNFYLDQSYLRDNFNLLPIRTLSGSEDTEHDLNGDLSNVAPFGVLCDHANADSDEEMCTLKTYKLTRDDLFTIQPPQVIKTVNSNVNHGPYPSTVIPPAKFDDQTSLLTGNLASNIKKTPLKKSKYEPTVETTDSTFTPQVE
ncbi:hypothetical protein HMI56_001128, partial [Coelomomyces lativittatus]